MKTINKKISLEQFKSRLPSIVPSYNKDEFIERIDNTNYGMFPTDIKLNGKQISFNTLSNWYHFFQEYNSLLNDNISQYGNSLRNIMNNFYNSNISYGNNSDYGITSDYGFISSENAKEYYKRNKSKSKYSYNQCVEMDNKYDTIKRILNAPSDITSFELYETYIKKYIPNFEIPQKFQKKWKKKQLSINEVLFWNKWFTNKSFYNEIENCEDATDCCECEKYKSLGGEEFNELLREFINSLTVTLPSVNDSIVKDTYINIPIALQNSIKNIGDFSLFSEDFEKGVNYKKGDIVIYNDKIWKLIGNKSYFYSNTFKEMYFGNLTKLDEYDYKNYIDTLNGSSNIVLGESNNDNWSEVKINRNDISNGYLDNNFNLNYSSYTCVNNEIIYNPKFKDIAKKINIINKKCCLIDNKIYEVNDIDYVIYNNILLPIQYEDEIIKLNPYASINGKIYYANYDDNLKNYYFEFNCNDKNYVIINPLIKYNNQYIALTSDNQGYYVNVNQNKYRFTDFYCIINDTNFLINSSNELCNFKLENDKRYKKITLNLESDAINGKKGYMISDSILYLFDDYYIYNLNKVSGYTESKLSSFKSIGEYVYDNLGNQMNGSYPFDLTVGNGDWLDIPYLPNYVSDLTQISDNLYWGNLLESIEYYYVDYYGNKISDLTNRITVNNLNNRFRQYSIISSLTNSYQTYEMSEDFISTHFSIDSNLRCDITYYLGCELTNANSKYQISGSSGIKYIDTITLIPKQQSYYIDKNNSFEINYFEMIWDKINFKMNGTDLQVNKAYFEYNINPDLNDLGFINAPIVKEEYKLWSSSLENVKSDIYIQRGLSRALDNHLKLLEVKSLESLTNYGNSQFNIIKS